MAEFNRRSDSIKNVLTALDKAQTEFNPVVKDQFNPHLKSKYANLAGTIEATEGALHANGLVMSQPAVYRDDKAGCLTILYHIPSDEYLAEELLIPLEKMSGQGVGTAISYARRFSRLGMLGIAAEDDDGHTASSGPETKEATKPPSTPKASLEPFKEGSHSEQVQTTRFNPADMPAKGTGTNMGDSPASVGGLPTVPELAAFKARATKLTKDLIAAGATVSEGGPSVGQQVKDYLLRKTAVSDLKEISTTSWVGLLDDLETRIKNQPKVTVQLIQCEKEATV